MPQSNKIYLNKNDGNHYIFATTSVFGGSTKTDNSISVENTIEQADAMKMISEGYKLVAEPDAISPILRYTGILNPYSKYRPGFATYTVFQPTQMITQDGIDSIYDKQGIIVFSTSKNIYTPGIWTEEGYQGSLERDSYIFIETSNSEETLTTYFGGKLLSQRVPVEKGAVSYVEFDTSIGWETHNRRFKLSNELEFQHVSSALKYLVLNRDADVHPTIEMIENEGLKILGSIIQQ